MAIQDISSQSNRNHAVPQNIMDVEFKIIGDLTMRQFSYLLIFGLMAYFNSQVMVGIFKWPLTLFFTLLGVGLAFVPVQDRGLDVWLVNFIKSVYRPTQMVWKKSVVLPTAFMYDNINVLKQELITLAPTSSRRKLEEYLDYSKTKMPVDPLDIPEAEYIKKVRESFREFPISQIEVPVKPIEVKPTPVSTLLPPKEVPSIITSAKIITPKVEPLVTTKPPIQAPVSVPPKVVEIAKKEEKISEIKPEVKPVEVTTISKPVIAVQQVSTPVIKVEDISYTPLTPDRHTGRRFTSFLPSTGELVLPIRGEKVLSTTDQEELEEDLASKTEKLQLLLNQIRQSNIKPTKKPEAVKTSLEQINATPVVTVPKSVEQPVSKPVAPIKEAQPTITIEPVKEQIPILRRQEPKISQLESFVVERKPISKSVEEPKSPGVSNISKEKQLEIAKVTLANLGSKRTEIMNKLVEYKNSKVINYSDKISVLEKELQKVNTDYQELKIQVESIEGSTQDNIPANAKDISQMQALNVPALDKPNVLWGFVKDISGKPLAETVVIVKNVRGEPVRATKTNELGQFILSTPLNNGKYSAEISSSSMKDISFDIVSLEASGNIIPAIEFRGK